MPRLREAPDDASVRAAITSAQFAPRLEAWITPRERAKFDRRPDANTASVDRAVRFESETPTEIELTLPAGPAGYVVLTDAALSGWSARCDGHPLPLARCNAFCRVVEVPATACRLRFSYRAPGLAAGMWLSLAGVLLWIALVVRGRGGLSKDRPTRDHVPPTDRPHS